MLRRNFVKGGSKVLAAGALGFPSIVRSLNAAPTIRVVGTHVTLQEPIRKRAEQDLGIRIEFYPGGSAEVLLKASMDPSSFDLYEQWSNSTRVLWQARAIAPIETRRITHWGEIGTLSKTGRLSPEARLGAGDAPNKILFVQPDGALGGRDTGLVSYLPYVHNTDSFGYNSAAIERGIPYQTESWGWLLDERHRGRVGIINEPAIGIFDLALAVQARGLMEFADIGNMTTAEVDELFSIVGSFKKQGQFRGFWYSVPDSVRLMARGEVDIQSMFSPGVSALKGLGVPCVYAAPKEGYRAWHGVMCMSRECKGEQQEAAYAFMNWWLSGWPGAFVARQGYYISNPDRSRAFMSRAEWDYWYDGKPAAEPLRGTDGKVSVQPGEVRSGGSYERRFSNIAVWNTVMPIYDYTLGKWGEFVLG